MFVCVCGGGGGRYVKEGVLNYMVSKVICSYQIKKKTINPTLFRHASKYLTVELAERGPSLMNGLLNVIPKGKQAPAFLSITPNHRPPGTEGTRGE